MLAAHVAERLVRRNRGPHARTNLVETTTISRTLQEQFEHLARDRATTLGGGVSVAIIAVDNATGEVRAHVGGVGYFDKARAGQIDLAQALRSPGSTLKPFIYGLAFEDGLAHPETLVDDRPIRFGLYKPENFDEAFQGTVTMRRALQQSLNVPAVMLLNALGPNRLIARMKNAGAAPQLPPDAAPGLAVGLGGAGVKLTDLATLYLALARQWRGRAARLASAGSKPCRAAAPPVRQGGGLAGRQCAHRRAGAAKRASRQDRLQDRHILWLSRCLGGRI